MTLASLLFETGALKVSSYKRPFFYTSGKPGPFYVNTHFLYGDKKTADHLLKEIDHLLLTDRDMIPKVLTELTYGQYKNNEVYKSVINSLRDLIIEKTDLDSIGYISGGERRDWFFSYIIAKLVLKKHITIFKDKKVLITGPKGTAQRSGKVIHVCDLVTEASSFKNNWLPALTGIGRIDKVFSVVDRDQGGSDYFGSENITLFSLIKLNRHFFEQAKEQKYIDLDQRDMIIDYKRTDSNFYNIFSGRR